MRSLSANIRTTFLLMAWPLAAMADQPAAPPPQILPPGWVDTRPLPHVNVTPDMLKPLPGGWTKDSFAGLQDALQAQAKDAQAADKGVVEKALTAAPPPVNQAKITVLAFFNGISPTDDAGLCKIADAAKAHPDLVSAAYYVVVQPGPARATAPTGGSQPKGQCLSQVQVKFDIGGRLYFTLAPEGLPAALFMYKGLQQWVRLQDAGLAIHELYLDAGVPDQTP